MRWFRIVGILSLGFAAFVAASDWPAGWRVVVVTACCLANVEGFAAAMERRSSTHGATGGGG